MLFNIFSLCLISHNFKALILPLMIEVEVYTDIVGTGFISIMIIFSVLQ